MEEQHFVITGRFKPLGGGKVSVGLTGMSSMSPEAVLNVGLGLINLVRLDSTMSEETMVKHIERLMEMGIETEECERKETQ